MKKSNGSIKNILVLSCITAALVISGCQKEGSAEKAGKTIDRAAEKAGEKMGKAADKAGEKLESAKEAVTDKAQTAGEYIDDSVITTKVKSALVGDSMLHASQIEVVTTDGVVKLTGTVDQEPNIARAVTVASSVEHVKSVQTDLRVVVPAPGK